MNIHQKDECAKLKREKTIRKRTNDSPTNPNLANLLKVNRTKVPPKRKFIQSPKKRRTGAKSRKKTTPPGSPLEDQDLEDAAQLQRTLEDSEDSEYNPQEDFDVHEVATAKKPRRSNRTTKRPEKYGRSETLSTDDDTEDTELG